MKRLLTVLLISFFSISSLYAADTKTEKKPSAFMLKIMAMKKQQEEARTKTKKIEIELAKEKIITEQKRKNLKDIKELGKSLKRLSNVVSANK